MGKVKMYIKNKYLLDDVTLSRLYNKTLFLFIFSYVKQTLQSLHLKLPLFRVCVHPLGWFAVGTLKVHPNIFLTTPIRGHVTKQKVSPLHIGRIDRPTTTHSHFSIDFFFVAPLNMCCTIIAHR